MISLFPVPTLINSIIFTISILFSTFKILLTQELSLPLPFFKFLSKITQNYTQIWALFTATQKKKTKRETGKVF